MTRGLAVGAAMLLLVATPAYSHRLDEYLQATMITLGKDRVHVQIQLTPGVAVFPRLIAGIDTDVDGVVSGAEERAYAARVVGDLSLAVDGTSLPLRFVSSTFASVDEMKEGRGEIQIEFDAVVPSGNVARRLTFENRHQRGISVYLVNALVPRDPDVRITSQHRSVEQASYQLTYAQGGDLSGRSFASGSWSGFTSVFQLGMRHIAEGTDHLLFLLVLLLPAPMIADGGRWARYGGVRHGAGQLLRIVTAFTVGHSLTLAAAATGWVHAPSGPVEVLIALSILVSAAHAVRPLFPGREAIIAAGFGLVHGLAFATMISGSGGDAWHSARTVFGFNLGIEVMQLVVVIATVPWLLTIARTRAYESLRVVGAAVAGVAALGWIGERAFGLANPIGVWVERVAASGPALVVVLAIVALAVTAWERSGRTWRISA